MTIALIIPFKDAAPWLTRCLDSIKGPFVVIMVDDGSTDGGADIVDKYDNHGYRINLMKYERNQGVSHARNIGIRRALELGTDYITFLDADDTLEPDAWENINAAIKEEPDAQIIQLNHRKQTPEGMKPLRFFNPRGIYELDKLPKLWVLVWNKVYKSELLESIEFKEGLRHGEDELFNLECLKVARSIYCSERVAVTHHFDNPKSLSRITGIYDLIDEQDALIQFILDNAPQGVDGDEIEESFQLLEAVRRRQAELWDNPIYKRVIGGAR